ncbi:uncharacterized protein METZ01_LOCUS138641, partial [marine metagenome]
VFQKNVILFFFQRVENKKWDPGRTSKVD